MGLRSWAGRRLFLRWLGGQVREWKMGKAWQVFDGWKTVIGGVAYMAVLVYDQMANGHAGEFAGAILAVLGFDPAALGIEWGKAAAAGALIVGVGHRIWKANAQARAGVPRAELLSATGYVRAASRAPRRK